jgi:peptidoglycan hydrolase-like protein with peptidoglycan-binding domain
LLVEKYRLSWQLQIGHLDPVDDSSESKPLITGIQARLNNLGYHCGPVDGIMGPKTKMALQRFQSKAMQRKDPDGEPDDDTRRALETEHLC